MAQYSQLTHPTIYRPEDQGYLRADIYLYPLPSSPKQSELLTVDISCPPFWYEGIQLIIMTL